MSDTVQEINPLTGKPFIFNPTTGRGSLVDPTTPDGKLDAHDRLAKERDAVAQYCDKHELIDGRASPLFYEALDALIEKAKLVGRVEALREAAHGDEPDGTVHEAWVRLCRLLADAENAIARAALAATGKEVT